MASEMTQGQEHEFRAVAEAMPQIVWTTTPDGANDYFNHQWCLYTGLSQAESRGEGWNKPFHPDDQSRAREAWRRAVAEDGPYDLECRLRRADGVYRWWLVRGLPVRDDAGRITRWAGTCTDIDDLKQAQAAVYSGKAKLEAALAALTDAVFISDAEGRFVDFNDAFATFHRFPDKASCARTLAEYPDLIDVFMDNGELLPLDMWAVPRALRGETATGVEYTLRRKDTGETWIGNYSFGPIRDGEGRVVGSVVSGRDVTASRRAEAALRQSEERHRLLADNALDVIWTMDLQGRFTYVSPSVQKLRGYTPAEVMAQTVAEALTPGSAALVQRQFEAALSTLARDGVFEDFRGELEQPCRDGSTVWTDVSVSPLRDGGGTVIGFLGVTRDITERRRAAQEKERLEAQLAQAQKLESVGLLAGGVAHDFNNMLAVILGRSEIAMAGLDPAHPLFGALAEIRGAATRSAELTRQLLAFARRQTVVPRVLDLNQAVDGVLSMLRRLIGEGIRLDWQPGPGLWPVLMDPSQVDQILANLCVNARDAIADVGTITIETGNCLLDEDACRLHDDLDPGCYVRLSVRDDGCGMDAPTVARVFEPFFTTKGVGQGSGLGLATVYGAVRQNQGLVTVASEPGRGTVLNVFLPRASVAVHDVAAPVAETVRDTGSEVVLVVEDEQAILEMIEVILGRKGYTVLSATSPAAALEIAGRPDVTIDLLLTDVVMPGMNGRDLARRLAGLQPGLKVVYMSGYTADIMAVRNVLDRGTPFLQKPFGSGDLASRVRLALDQGGGGADSGD